MLVEINPPETGIARGTQGLIGRDSEGGRWILHGGRIHPGKKRVDTATFGRLSGLKTVPVHFSDGSTRNYYPVAPLDAGPEPLHAALGSFIGSCGYVRTRFLHGKDEADLDKQVTDGEGSSRPERRGKFAIPPRGEVEAERIHADVWKVLAAALDSRGIAHSNSRVGRYGPDLRTRAKPLVLFEIKTDTTARSVYEALGQLLIYQRLLQKQYTKVLVVPGVPPARLVTVLKEYEVGVLTYAKTGRTFTLDVTKVAGIQ